MTKGFLRKDKKVNGLLYSKNLAQHIPDHGPHKHAADDKADAFGELIAIAKVVFLDGLETAGDPANQAADAFAAYYEKGEVRPDGSYLMDHSRAGYLLDRDGKPIALLPVEESAEGVAAELAKWVR